MSDFRARLLKEQDELSLKVTKLKTFILSETFEQLAEIEKTALKTQLQYIKSYAYILSQRVSRLCTGNN